MERCASTQNLSTLKRLSSTIRGWSTTSRWERAVWVGECTWCECCVEWVHVAISSNFVVYEWKEGPVVKGWQWCHSSFTQNEYFMKNCLWTPSKAFVLQSFLPQCIRWCVGGGTKWSMRLPDCHPLSSPFFCPLLTSPPFHLCLCSFCAVAVCEC